MLFLFASLLLLAVSTLSWAYDFKVDGIYYDTNGSNAFVTYEKFNNKCYFGDVTIQQPMESRYHIAHSGT